jgi:acylaminoacyl-peptidase
MPTTTRRKTKTKKKTTKRSSRRRITPEDLLRITFVADAQISPDGAAAAFVRKHVGDKNEYVSNIWLACAEGNGTRQFTNGGRDRAPRWSPDGSRLAFVGAREKTRPQLYTINATGGEATPLTDFPEGTIGAYRWAPNGRHLAVAFRPQAEEWTTAAKKEREEKGLTDPPRVIDHWWYRLDGDGYFDAQRFALYVIDAETGAHRKLYGADMLGFFSFDFSPDSTQLVVSTNRDKRVGLRAWNDELLRIRVATGKITPIPGLPEGPKDAVAWSPDGKTIAYAGREGGDSTYSTENLELWVCDPVKGRAKCLTGSTDYCLMAAPMSDTAEVAFDATLWWAPNSKRIFMQLGWHGAAHVASVKRSGGAVTRHTGGQRLHNPGNFSRDGKRLALTVGTPTVLDEVHIADVATGAMKTRAITNENGPLLKELDLAKPRAQWVTAPDGTKVHTWVLRPPHRAERSRCPAVLEIHGGPHAQYGLGFFHEFQVLAANGYVVVYSNPRGSKGYGRDHCHAIRGKWGTVDWVDVEAVANFMADLPFVDQKRMGVMGGSYGGYMTNWAIGHTNMFAGAITDRCVSNMVSMGGTSDFIDEPDRYFPGNHWDDTEGRETQSPIRFIGKAKTPTLVIHSEGDLRCNVEQAEQLYTALVALKVPTRLVRYPRTTSHGMSRGGPPDMRLHRLHQILGWWKRYLS